MSFSGNVKKELEAIEPKSQHCRLAEFDAIASLAGRFVVNSDGEAGILLKTDRVVCIRKFFTIADKAFKIKKDFLGTENRGKDRPDHSGETLMLGSAVGRIQAAVSAEDKLARSCCRRAYLRGAFLAAGTISDPEKYYHLEIDCVSESLADTVRSLLEGFGLNAKTVRRRDLWVVYIKEGDQLAEMLRLIGANRSLMEFENVRILRERRGSVNRRVNCETANLKKTVNAAVRQVDDIRYLQEKGILGRLSPALQEMAELRLLYPDVSLQELGTRMMPPVGKSGVNHRMRKLQEAAAAGRAEDSEEL